MRFFFWFFEQNSQHITRLKSRETYFIVLSKYTMTVKVLLSTEQSSSTIRSLRGSLINSEACLIQRAWRRHTQPEKVSTCFFFCFCFFCCFFFSTFPKYFFGSFPPRYFFWNRTWKERPLAENNVLFVFFFLTTTDCFICILVLKKTCLKAPTHNSVEPVAALVEGHGRYVQVGRTPLFPQPYLFQSPHIIP